MDCRFRIQLKPNKNEHVVSLDSAYKGVFWIWSLYWPRQQMCCCTFDTKVASHRIRFLTWARVLLLTIFVHAGCQACSAYISEVKTSLSANRTDITSGHSEVKSTYTLHSRLRTAPPSLRYTIVLYEIQWFILVTFKSDTPKSEVHELGDPHHTLSVYCGQYIRITSKKSQLLLSKKDWSQLLDMASACTDREVIKYGRLQEELAELRNKC